MSDTFTQLSQMAEVAKRHEWLVKYDIDGQGFNHWPYPNDDYNGDTEKQNAATLALMTQRARELRADPLALHEPSEKIYTEWNFTIKVKFPTFNVRIQTTRSTACVRKVIGTETVEEIDTDNAPKKLVEREIVEWECKPINDA